MDAIMNQVVKIAANGRLVLPKSARAALGIEDAGVLTLEIEGDQIRLSSLQADLKRAQALYRKYVKNGTSSEEFIKERRREAAREEAKWG
jgi:bifunctional DNA-binding transcriptional regulator/antitoxin component of YhaV-PrlF toxin-antitoxin module